MTESTSMSEPSKLWTSLSEPEQEACVYFAVSDWKTGVGRDYIDAMGIEEDNLTELVKKGIVEMKPTWKLFQDLADQLEEEVKTIRGRDVLTTKLNDDERETLQSYDRYKSISERKEESPRYHLTEIKFHDYIKSIDE